MYNNYKKKSIFKLMLDRWHTFGQTMTGTGGAFVTIASIGAADRMLEYNFKWSVESMYIGIIQPRFINETDFDDEIAKNLSSVNLNDTDFTIEVLNQVCQSL